MSWQWRLGLYFAAFVAGTLFAFDRLDEAAQSLSAFGPYVGMTTTGVYVGSALGGLLLVFALIAAESLGWLLGKIIFCLFYQKG